MAGQSAAAPGSRRDGPPCSSAVLAEEHTEPGVEAASGSAAAAGAAEGSSAPVLKWEEGDSAPGSAAAGEGDAEARESDGEAPGSSSTSETRGEETACAEAAEDSSWPRRPGPGVEEGRTASGLREGMSAAAQTAAAAAEELRRRRLVTVCEESNWTLVTNLPVPEPRRAEL